MYFGVDYYPEHWPCERWPVDADMMKEAGFNTVRLAEFAWAKLEPDEGAYDFSWLDKAIQILTEKGLGIVLGTPTAAAPKWLMNKYPDMYPQNSCGRKLGFGLRRHYCFNNENYQEYTKKIVSEMARHYKSHNGIIAWQIDNEFGGRCYCSSCHKAFIRWLKGRYGNIENLNNAWGTVFWSQTYKDWNDVIIPLSYFGEESQLFHNPSLLLDYYRFSSESAVAYQKIQADIIRENSNLPITHNLMGHFSEIDYFNLGKGIDFVSWDNYPNTQWGKSSYKEVSMAHDLMRGVKNRNFWVMEQQSGPCGWLTMGDTPEPGQLRLWTYQSVSHGADGIVYFRWRPCVFGREQYWHGILDHDGIGRRRYDEIKKTGAELMSLKDLLFGAEVAADAAVIKSYDNVWSHHIFPNNKEFDYNKLLMSYYNSLLDNNINADVTCAEADFSKYKLVLMPAYGIMSEGLRVKCEKFVSNGGSLLITFRSGIRDLNNCMTTKTLPGEFRELAGVELYEFDSLNNGRKVNVNGYFWNGTSRMWCDVIVPYSAEVLAEYTGSFYAGKPAVTVNSYGLGKVYYVGCDLDENAMKSLIGFVAKEAGIKPVIEHKVEGVEVVKRIKNGKSYLMILNHNNMPIKMLIDWAYKEDVLKGEHIKGEINLDAYGVAILV